MKVLIATAMYPTPENPAYGSFIRTQVQSLEQIGVEIELLVFAARPHQLMYPKGIIQLRRRLASNRIDLVHAHFSYVGMAARTQWQAPVVVTYHGDDLLGTVGNMKGAHTRCSRLIVAAGQILGQYADAAIVQTQEMAAKLKSEENVYIIPHEVDFELFRPINREDARRVLGLQPGKKYLLFAADPRTPVKNFPLARAIADHLSQQEPDLELLVVYKETQDCLALYMNACDALVFPSFQEGSPNVVKQAMACNLPIVATDVGDVQEVIGATPGCYVCKPDITAFAARLKDILQHRPRTCGREHIRHFDHHTVARKVLHVYEQTLKKHQSR
ncbi:MAG: glycosyltransferase [Candidatus Tectomicrobia bacterium]|nr:glycosyltransferase [Candidatus Tectomicrobia bacterium]